MQNRIPGRSLLLGQLTHQAPGLMWDAAGPERWHMQIDRVDHLVLTVADIERNREFYRWILGFEPVTFADNRKALVFGRQKINLHRLGQEFEPRALRPTGGSADLCFIATPPLDTVIRELHDKNVAIEIGPVDRTGALGAMRSIYIRDPDQNLIEISNCDA
jgi:catechol 2,3-dioxygenase-like lactoylglutathione lyase family enzyme